MIPLTFTVLNRCQGFFHCKASPYVQPLSCALTCSYWHTKRFSIFRSVGRDSPCRLMSSIRFTTESLKVIQPTEPSKTASNTTTLQSANKYGNPSFQTWAQAWKNKHQLMHSNSVGFLSPLPPHPPAPRTNKQSFPALLQFSSSYCLWPASIAPGSEKHAKLVDFHTAKTTLKQTTLFLWCSFLWLDFQPIFFVGLQLMPTQTSWQHWAKKKKERKKKDTIEIR